MFADFVEETCRNRFGEFEAGGRPTVSNEEANIFELIENRNENKKLRRETQVPKTADSRRAGMVCGGKNCMVNNTKGLIGRGY